MRQTINEEVNVITYYSAKKKKFIPYRLNWQNKDYVLGPVDYYHPYEEGKTLIHIFELCDDQESLWFRLRFDSSNLHWTLEAIHDGNAD